MCLLNFIRSHLHGSLLRYWRCWFSSSTFVVEFIASAINFIWTSTLKCFYCFYWANRTLNPEDQTCKKRHSIASATRTVDRMQNVALIDSRINPNAPTEKESKKFNLVEMEKLNSVEFEPIMKIRNKKCVFRFRNHKQTIVHDIRVLCVSAFCLYDEKWSPTCIRLSKVVSVKLLFIYLFFSKNILPPVLIAALVSGGACYSHVRLFSIRNVPKTLL